MKIDYSAGSELMCVAVFHFDFISIQRLLHCGFHIRSDFYISKILDSLNQQQDTNPYCRYLT